MISYLFRFLFLIPIGLVIASGELIRRRAEPAAAGRRTFLFLAWTGAALWAVLLLAAVWRPVPGLEALLALNLLPAAIGVLAMALLHVRKWQALQRPEKRLLLLVVLLLVLVQAWTVATDRMGSPDEAALLVAGMILIPVCLWAIWAAGRRVPMRAGLAVMGLLLLFNGLEGGSLPLFEYGAERWLTAAIALLYLMLPALAIPMAAVLLVRAVRPSSGDSWPAGRRLAAGVLAVLLVVYFLYTVLWLKVWDGSDDGIRTYFMLMLSIFVSTAAGMVVAMTSTGWRRWSGFVLAAAVIWLVRGVVVLPGNQFNPYAATEERAARIRNAIETHYASTGVYPEDLQELTPGRLLKIPLPMIIPGEGWCYESGPDHYRLGTIYREHWSSPHISIHVYASAGSPPEGPWSCEQRLVERQALAEASQSR